MDTPLTTIQRKIFRFIEEETAAHGAPPTLRAIREAFRFRAIGTVQDHVRALVRKGFLDKDPGKARGLRLAERHRSAAMSVPILGAVAAGPPREAEELILGALPVPAHLVKKGNCFALRVAGDSMVDAGIHDGDLVVARQQSTARNGDIVVALVGGETTVKRMEKKAHRIRLLAENAKFPPIDVESERDVIQGKVIGVFRSYE